MKRLLWNANSRLIINSTKLAAGKYFNKPWVLKYRKMNFCQDRRQRSIANGKQGKDIMFL